MLSGREIVTIAELQFKTLQLSCNCMKSTKYYAHRNYSDDIENADALYSMNCLNLNAATVELKG